MSRQVWRGNSEAPVYENGRNWAVNMLDSAFSRFTSCIFFFMIFPLFRSRSRSLFRRHRLRLQTKCSDGSGSGRNVSAPVLHPPEKKFVKWTEWTELNWTESLDHRVSKWVERTFQSNWWLGNWTILNWCQTILNFERENLVCSRTLPALARTATPILSNARRSCRNMSNVNEKREESGSAYA